MNHKELRKESEPPLNEIVEERKLPELKTIPQETNFSIDYDLIGRVLAEERKRYLEKQWNGQAGLRAKRLNSSVTGKKLKRA